jgi:hypothetical protein
MQGNDREHSHQDLWKSQEDVPMKITSDEVRVKAIRYERESLLVYWVVMGLTPLFFAAFLYNLVRLREPLLIAGTGFGLATWCSIAWKILRNGPNRISPVEPCLDFLRREFEGKRRGLLWVRGCVLLLIPAVMFSWWGGGPVLRAQAWGTRSPRVLSFLAGPGMLVAMAPIIAFLWFAFSRQARKVKGEIDKLPRP